MTPTTYHKCPVANDKFPSVVIAKNQEDYGKEPDVWYLDMIDQHTVINHCPYCGAQLEQEISE